MTQSLQYIAMKCFKQSLSLLSAFIMLLLISTYSLYGASAKAATATVTASDNTGQTMPDRTCVTRTYNIASSLSVTKVTLALAINHTYMADFEMTLTNPSGTVVSLMNRNGGGGNNINLIFDDAAGPTVTSGGAPFNGPHRPRSPLSAFNGQGSQGNWTLSACDTWSQDSGEYLSSLLSVTGIVPNAPPVANAGPDQSVSASVTVNLDGSASSDPDAGDSISRYQWSGPASVSLSNANTANPSFVAPNLPFNAPAQVLEFALEVEDQNGATHTDTVRVTVNAAVDTDVPTVVLTTTTTELLPDSRFIVKAEFSEAVSGLSPSDFAVENGSVIGISGGSQTYTLQVEATGGGAFTIMLPANTVVDQANNGNTASNKLEILSGAASQTEKLIAEFMHQRANYLLSNQPDLIPFLRDQVSGGQLSGGADEHQGNLRFSAVDSTSSFWSQANASWDNNSKQRYAFGAFGGHYRLSENALIGAMVEVDHLHVVKGVATVEGTGYLAGPYVVATVPNQNVYAEARVLYGQSQNSISPFGTYWDDFETERWLAQTKLSGEVKYDSLSLYPFVGASYTSDQQQAYIDSLGNTVNKQEISLTQVEAGLNFSQPIAVPQGDLSVVGGVSGIWSTTHGAGTAANVVSSYEGARAKASLGLNYEPMQNFNINAEVTYDGIGSSDYRNVGAGLGFEFKF